MTDLFSVDAGGVLTSPDEGLLQLKSFDLKLGFQSRGFVQFGPVFILTMLATIYTCEVKLFVYVFL